MIDINADRALPMRWEYAVEKEGNHSILIVERGNRLLIGYDVPEPNKSYDESGLKSFEVPAGMKLGPELCWKLLWEHIDKCRLA